MHRRLVGDVRLITELEIVIGDLVTGCPPHSVLGLDIGKYLVERLDEMWLTRYIRVQCNAHDDGTRLGLVIENVELVDAHPNETLGGPSPGVEADVIEIQGVRNRTEPR